MKLKKSLLHGIGFLCLACLASAQDTPPAPPPDKPAPPPERPQGGPPPGDPGSRVAEFLKRVDSDGDGKISKDEFGNMGKREAEDRFSRMDGNKDGFVDQAEMTATAQNMRRGPDGQGMRRPGGEGGPPGGGQGFRRPPGGDAPQGQPQRPQGPPQGEPQRPGGPPQGGSPDGRPGGSMRPGGEGGRGMGMLGDPKENFKRMDADGNGSVSEDEYLKATERLREMMRSRGGFPGGRGQGPGQGPGGSGGFRRPGTEGGPPGGGDGGFRRPPVEGDQPKPDGEKPKDGA